MFDFEFEIQTVKLSQLQITSIPQFEAGDYDCKVIIDYGFKLENLEGLDTNTKDLLKSVFWHASCVKVYKKLLDYENFKTFNTRLISELNITRFEINSAYTNKEWGVSSVIPPRINFVTEIPVEKIGQFVEIVLDITGFSLEDFKDKKEKGGKIWYSI